GDTLTYTITVTNHGPDAAQNVTLTNAFPASTALVSFTAPALLPSLAAGAGATFMLVLTIPGGVAGGTMISDTVSVASDTDDPVSGNDSATATTTVTALPAPTADLTVAITAAPDPVI